MIARRIGTSGNRGSGSRLRTERLVGGMDVFAGFLRGAQGNLSQIGAYRERETWTTLCSCGAKALTRIFNHRTGKWEGRCRAHRETA